MTILPLLLVAGYMFVALKVFTEDKIAYVYDSINNVTGALSSQVRGDIESNIVGLSPIIQDYLLFGKLSDASKKAFLSYPSWQIFGAYDRNSQGKYELKEFIEKDETLYNETLSRLGNRIDSIFLQSLEKNRGILVPFNDDYLFIWQKFEDTATGRSNIFLSGVRLGSRWDMIRESGAQSIFLTDATGNAIVKPDDLQVSHLGDIVDVKALQLGSGLGQGTVTVKGVTGEDYLASITDVGFADLVIVSLVEKGNALKAVQVLLKKSIVFLGFLICLTLVVSILASQKVMGSLTELFAATKQIAKGNFNVNVGVTSSDEVGALASNFNKMAQEVSRLLAQTAEKARMEAELNTAKTVQETLFPLNTFSKDGVEIAGFYEPASECGGDWWYYSEIDDKVYFWIGDATGHGAASALITSAARSAASVIEQVSPGPGAVLQVLNRAIYDVSKGQIMMTFFVGAYDKVTRKLTYANASHEPPFLINKKDGEIKKKDLIPLIDVNGPRLGQNRETNYQEAEVDLKKGDYLFFYTDGVTDIRNPAGEGWGERAFVKSLTSSLTGSDQAINAREKFTNQFSEFRKQSGLVDDVTFFMVRIGEENLHV